MSNRIPNFPTNRLLASLPAHEMERLLPSMRLVFLELKQVLCEDRAPMPYVYFPTQGVVSQVLCTSDGDQIEVGVVGNEGMVGLSVLLGEEESPARYFAQVPGTAYRMPAAVLRAETRWESPLRRVLNRYLAAHLRQLAQAVACSGLHAIPQRCARWLLMTHDRVEGDSFPLTHEFLATMLGVRRSSVSEILQPLARQGLIRNGRGQVTILDRAGLEALSCECYRAVKDEMERLRV
jgi:CRP-like cAMP-binding protein